MQVAFRYTWNIVRRTARSRASIATIFLILGFLSLQWICGNQLHLTNSLNLASGKIAQNSNAVVAMTHESLTGNEFPGFEQWWEGQDENSLENTRNPTTKSTSACPLLSLEIPTEAHVYGACKPHEPTEESCRIAQEYYYLEPGLTKCKQTTQYVCRMQENGSGKVDCNLSLCKEGQNDSFIAQTLDPQTGSMTASASFTTSQELETGLPRLVEENKKNNFNFIILKCMKHDGERVMQLLPTDPRLTIAEHPTDRRDQNAINVNVVLLDSLSRAHFYRSLPQTIKTFGEWKAGKSSKVEIFDFELFQAVHGHTAENTHALFTGELIPSSKKDKQHSVEPEVLFGNFKKAGYQTMWQEDLCWEGVWGLMTDLIAATWDELQEKTKQSFIDNTGMTHSSCELLRSLKLKSPFYGPDQICFNGKFQHSYFFQYIQDTLRAISASPKAKPLLSYLSLSVPHDHRGRRTQTLDLTLADYVTAMSQDSNTLTVILADHGNTYTTYATLVPEGRFEMFHPSLFVIVPKRVAELLGDKAMSALRENQRRLVTIIELHHSLMALVGPLKGGVAPQGLFKPVSVNRTCDDLVLRLPNLCVCEGWEVPTKNDSLRVIFVNFAIGQLNNLVEEQYVLNNKGKSPAFRACARLVPIRFEAMRERNSPGDGTMIISFDVYVKAGDAVEQKEDIFRVYLKSKETIDEKSLDLSLLSYDRLSIYGKYKVCADPGVDLKLCVCSKKRSPPANGTDQLEAALLQDFLTDFGQPPEIKHLGSLGCLYLIKRAYNRKGDSFAYDIGNFCDGHSFEVVFEVESENMKLSRVVPFEVKVSPGRIIFALAATKHVVFWESYINVNVRLQPVESEGFKRM